LAARGVSPTNTSRFSSLRRVRKEITVGMSRIDLGPFPGNLPELLPVGEKDDGTKSFTFSLFVSIIYVNTFTLREI
jgi:hypothetical protein